MKHIILKSAFILIGFVSFNSYATDDSDCSGLSDYTAPIRGKVTPVLDELFAHAHTLLEKLGELADKIADKTYVCVKEGSDPIFYQLFKPGLEEGRLCELKSTTITAIGGGETITSMSFPQEFQSSDPEWSSEDSCEKHLASRFLEKIRDGYSCSK